MEVARSNYIKENKALFKKLQQRLSGKYGYASVLVSDGRQQSYSVSAGGVSVSDFNRFGKRGFVVRVHDGKAYAEYAGNEISEEAIEEIEKNIESRLLDMGDKWERYLTPVG